MPKTKKRKTTKTKPVKTTKTKETVPLSKQKLVIYIAILAILIILSALVHIKNTQNNPPSTQSELIPDTPWLHFNFNSSRRIFYLNIPDNPDLDMQNEGLTISAWVNLRQTSWEDSDFQSQSVVDRGHHGYVAQGYDLEIWRNGLGMNFGNGTSTFYPDTPCFRAGSGGCDAYCDVAGENIDGNLTLKNTWILVAGTYNWSSGDVNLYVDGKQLPCTDRNKSTPYININTSLPMTIGARDAVVTFNQNLNGTIAELKIYNRTLTQSEIIEINSSGFTTSRGNPHMADLKIWYNFAEGKDGVFYDKSTSGSMLNATLASALKWNRNELPP
ncbi:MAG: LamG domain-containing protein [archaeon]